MELTANGQQASSDVSQLANVESDKTGCSTNVVRRLNLNSESYKTAIQSTQPAVETPNCHYEQLSIEQTGNVLLGGTGCNNRSSLMIMQPASPSNFKSSYSPKSTVTSVNNPFGANLHHLHHIPTGQQQPQAENFQFNLLYKRQEANYYVQQILTDLLAIGVLEYESGFDNAINRTYKVKRIRTFFFVTFFYAFLFNLYKHLEIT